MDCFAEPVIGRRFAPTRWLAMTMLVDFSCLSGPWRYHAPPGTSACSPSLLHPIRFRPNHPTRALLPPHRQQWAPRYRAGL